MPSFQYTSQPPNKPAADEQHILVAEDRVLFYEGSCEQRVIFDHREQVTDLTAADRHFIGYYSGKPCYVTSVAQGEVDVSLPKGFEWRSLRSLLGVLPDEYFNWVGRAGQVIGAYNNHRFCGRCGGETYIVDNEHASRCGRCELLFYPRLSPCAIMVITRGEYCLLARNVNWTDWFSALAGFIEPGETVEQAVRRETMEEVGIEVGELTYVGSQPWPFPGQLMLGFHAEYKSGEIAPDNVEIAEADWFRYDDLPKHPGVQTLSGRLIQQFVDSF